MDGLEQTKVKTVKQKQSREGENDKSESETKLENKMTC